MAMTKCRECGNEVSTAAAACPHCGAPVKKAGPGPWTIIGWIIVICIGLWFWGLVKGEMAKQEAAGSLPGSAATASDTTAPGALSARLVSTECRQGGGRTRATVTIENTGPEISFAKMFITYIGDTSESTYASPSTIPPGARADFSFSRSRGAATGCQIGRLQDGSGHEVTLQ